MQSLDATQDLTQGESHRGLPAVRCDRHQVRQLRPSVSGFKFGGEDRCMVLVGAFRLKKDVGFTSQYPVLPVEQTVEARRTVEARQTQPVNRPTTGHERAGAAVADQCIVVYGDMQ